MTRRFSRKRRKSVRARVERFVIGRRRFFSECAPSKEEGDGDEPAIGYR